MHLCRTATSCQKQTRQPTPTCAVLLCLINECLHGLALGGEPEAIVDGLGVAGHDVILHAMHLDHVSVLKRVGSCMCIETRLHVEEGREHVLCLGCTWGERNTFLMHVRCSRASKIKRRQCCGCGPRATRNALLLGPQRQQKRAAGPTGWPAQCLGA